MHGATHVDFGMVMDVHKGEGLAQKVGNPITEIFMTRHDESSLLAIKVMSDDKCRASTIVMFRQAR